MPPILPDFSKRKCHKVNKYQAVWSNGWWVEHYKICIFFLKWIKGRGIVVEVYGH